MSFWEIVWFIFIFFAFMAYLMVLFSIFTDLFRDSSVSGWIKALWVILLIIFPLVTALIYLIVRGKGMTERSMRDAVTVRAAQEEYIKSVAGSGATPADQIAQAKAMLDAGTITQEEFAQLKAKALG